jgi:hypothetical protein
MVEPTGQTATLFAVNTSATAQGKGDRPRETKTMVEDSIIASRPLILTTLLGASIGVPYVASRMPSGADSKGWLPFGSGQPSTTASANLDGLRPLPRQQLEGPGALLYDSSVPLEGTRFQSLAEVLRFDLSREWVYQNWARKSTGLGDPELFGVRVALVTGTGASDVAGSLTYYFNRQGEVQHISLRGRTADTTPMIRFLADTYKFQRAEAPAGEQLYQIQRNGRVQSELRTRPEPILWTTSPHGSFAVELELERPGSNRFLPPRTPKLEIPQVASATPAVPATAASTSEAGASNKPGLVGEPRLATPAEEAQLQRMRWPN